MTKTSQEIRIALLAAGITTPSVFAADVTYKPCRSDWLIGEYDTWFRSALKALGLEKWSEENADCDDYADLYAVLARICHMRTNGSAGTALPVGVLWFNKQGVGGHAINVAVTSDQDVVFPEPQLAKTLLKLHSEEKTSAWLLKI